MLRPRRILVATDLRRCRGRCAGARRTSGGRVRRDARGLPHRGQPDALEPALPAAATRARRGDLQTLVEACAADRGRRGARRDDHRARGRARSPCSSTMACPTRSVVQVAEERHVDVLVVGSHGYTGLRQALLAAAVADKIVRYAHCAVLVARPSKMKKRASACRRRLRLLTDPASARARGRCAGGSKRPPAEPSSTMHDIAWRARHRRSPDPSGRPSWAWASRHARPRSPRS